MKNLKRIDKLFNEKTKVNKSNARRIIELIFVIEVCLIYGYICVDYVTKDPVIGTVIIGLSGYGLSSFLLRLPRLIKLTYKFFIGGNRDNK